MRRLKVGLLSSQNCLDRNPWSGILFCMQRALKARDLDLIYLGAPPPTSFWKGITQRFKKVSDRFNPQPLDYALPYQKLAVQVTKQLAEAPCDVIFAPVASQELTFLETDIPIVYCSDTTRSLWWKYYDPHPDPREKHWRSVNESAAMEKSSRLVYPSTWAADSVIHDHGVEATKVAVIPFGANMDTPPPADLILKSKKYDKCRLLLVGKEWGRKGGDIALETMRSLRKMGINAELTVVGTAAPDGVQDEHLTCIPFINKNIPEQLQKLQDLYFGASFFIFPTRAECYGIVICEANAFGLPVITTDQGGVSTIIQDGKNGYKLPLSASGAEYAVLIAEIFADRSRYEQLVLSSRAEYDTRLNWNTWAEKLHEVFLSVVD
jgi:glycosyltransferase involved in cell wall biosynthesis